MLGGKWQYKYSRPNFQCLMAILFCLCMLATCSDCINVKQLLITLICTSCRCGSVRDSYSGWSHWHCSTPLVSAWSLQGGKSLTWTRYELTWLQREKKILWRSLSCLLYLSSEEHHAACSATPFVVIEIHLRNSGSKTERGFSCRRRAAAIPVFSETTYSCMNFEGHSECCICTNNIVPFFPLS